MKKLFVSVPMKGRKEEEIRKSIAKMHKIAEAITGEELELINSYVEDNPPKGKDAIWYLSKSIGMLAIADVFIGISDRYEWNGCYIESEVAYRYGIKVITVNSGDVMDDWEDIQREKYNTPVYCEEWRK